jgi:hypothetical protein
MSDDDEQMSVEEARKLRSENASLRRRLHERDEQYNTLQAEHEGTMTRLGQLERAEIERIAGEHLIDATDVWQAQPDVQAFYDEEYKQIVSDKVVETAKSIIAAKPHLARPQSAPPPSERPIEGLRPGAAPETKSKTPTWASAIRGTGA